MDENNIFQRKQIRHKRLVDGETAMRERRGKFVRLSLQSPRDMHSLK